MTRNERQAMWQERIDAFMESDEASFSAWCAVNDITVQSMYVWLKKDRQITFSGNIYTVGNARNT